MMNVAVLEELQSDVTVLFDIDVPITSKNVNI